MHYSKYTWILLLGVAFILRLLPMWGNNFAFMYDNAKDSLAIMAMGTAQDLTLVGAVTSIPGVFNGPGYYYLSLPFNFIFGYSPLVNVVLIIALSLVNVYLAYRYHHWITALLYAVSIGVIGTQQSAWSPYLTALVTLPITLLLLEITHSKKIKDWWLVTLFLLISSTFHFQTAFGVVLLPMVILTFYLEKKHLTLKQIALSVGSFVLPFAPLLLFEVLHNFHQFKQVVAFIFNYESQAQQIGDNATGIGRLLELLRFWLEAAAQSVFPFSIGGESWLIGLAVFSLAGWYGYYHRRDLSPFGLLLLGPLLLYLVLPVKSYYLVALFPIWIVLISQSIQSFLSPRQQRLLVVFIALGVVVGLRQNLTNSRHYAQATATFYAPKQAAVAKVYELSQGKPFASYHFVPEVYDYTYQFIFLEMIRQGQPVPTEFSYAPGEVSYIPQKPALMAKLPSTGEIKPELIFLIVEKAVYSDVFDQWWQRVASNLTITSEHRINEAITVYQAIPGTITTNVADD